MIAAAAVAISKGLAEEGNNPKLVELVAAFESCKLTKEADVPTLFNFLDDSKPYVRVAAAIAISNFMIMQKSKGTEFGARLKTNHR